jgi:uncharacterized membrane protein ArfB
MGFLIQWGWYLIAFLLGSLVAWLIVAVSIKHTSEEAAIADLAGSQEIGADS